jgi:hypothetical protein
MEFNLPEDASVRDRVLAFRKFLDDEFDRTDTLVRDLKDTQSRLLVKTERAEIGVIRDAFRSLFERELVS